MTSLDMDRWRRKQERLRKRQEERTKRSSTTELNLPGDVRRDQQETQRRKSSSSKNDEHNGISKEKRNDFESPPASQQSLDKRKGSSILVRKNPNNGPSPQSLSSLSNASPFQHKRSASNGISGRKRLVFPSSQGSEDGQNSQNANVGSQNGGMVPTAATSTDKKKKIVRKRTTNLYDSDEEPFSLLNELVAKKKNAAESKTATSNAFPQTTTVQTAAASPAIRKRPVVWERPKAVGTFLMEDSDEDVDFDIFKMPCTQKRSSSGDTAAQKRPMQANNLDDDSDGSAQKQPMQANKLEDDSDQEIDLGLSHPSSAVDTSEAAWDSDDEPDFSFGNKKRHNPIALEKQRMQLSRVESPAIPQKSNSPSDDLWSDSDDEAPASTKKKARKSIGKLQSPLASKSTARQRRVDTITASDSNAPEPKRRKQRRSTGKGWQSYSNMHLEQDEEEEVDVAQDALKPDFENPKFAPSPQHFCPFVLEAAEQVDRGNITSTIPPVQVPAAMNRYLKEYQREGVEFMYSSVSKKQGCILGDDMGLGKTVQVIALLSALLRKEGTGKDLHILKKRRRFLEAKLQRQQAAADNAILFGRHIDTTTADATNDNDDPAHKMPPFTPVLVMVPPSVVQNWLNEFSTWGHFGVCAYHGSQREAALERIKNGLDEIMVVGSGQFGKPNHFEALNEISWKLVIVDEFHNYKNYNATGHKKLQELKSTHDCIMVGLSGTIMPNNHKELHSLVNLVEPGHLGSWSSFEKHVSKPIMLGRMKTAQLDAIERCNQRSKELQEKLRPVLLIREKETIEELKDELPMKDEKVVFCELSSIQKRIYEHVMSLPDYVLIRDAKGPCECGVNKQLFQSYRRLRNDKERVAWQKVHQKFIVCKRDCCRKAPWNPRKDEEDQPLYDPGAVLWKAYHPYGEPCERCPYCMLLPALSKLYKVCSHAALLQLEQKPEAFGEKSKDREAAENELEFAKVALTPDVLDRMPGGSYFRQDGIMDEHKLLSGKMEVLDELLRSCSQRNDRILIFSYSTQVLDLIQNYVKAEGHSFRRIDGTTPTSRRQGIVDEYQTDETIFLFLLSTKACGLGLNITAANVVIVFDVNWNPSLDEQAQDRAYRIGQKQDVNVIRLVSRGTIEELMYVRQVYKVQLKQETLGNSHQEAPNASRLFRGVAGDRTRKGELFGSENLLKYKDGSFMADIWKTRANSSKKLGGVQLHDTEVLCNAVSKMTEEDIEKIGAPELDPEIDRVAKKEDEDSSPDKPKKLIEAIGGREKEGKMLNAISHEDFLRGDRGEAALQQGDEGFDGEMGGMSQVVDNVLQHADINMEEDVDEDELFEGDETPNENMQNLVPLLDSIAEEVDVFECETQPIQELPVPIRIRSNVIPDIPSGDSSIEESRNIVLSRVRADTTRNSFPGSETRPAQESPRPDCVASGMMQVAARADANAEICSTRQNDEPLSTNEKKNLGQAGEESRNPFSCAQKPHNANIRLLGRSRKKMKQSKTKSRFTAADILG